MTEGYPTDPALLTHLSGVRSLNLAEEGNALRQRIYELKRREADLLGQLRQTMEDTADARLKLGRVNDEIARLAVQGLGP